jgi:hypothetical protein
MLDLHRIGAVAAAFLLACGSSMAQTLDLTTAYSYQGRITGPGPPVEGQFPVTFSLWDQPENGTLLAETVPPLFVGIRDGLFSVELDFGSEHFTGEERWLGLTFDLTAIGQGIVTMTRQQILAAPMAIQTRGLYVNDEGGVEVLGAGNNERRSGLWSDGEGTISLTSADVDSPRAVRRLTVQSRTGFVGIGTENPQDLLDVRGVVRAQAVRLVGGGDIAEPFEISSDIELRPGMVVSIDPDAPGALRVADAAYDHAVAGVISGAGGVNAGLVLSQEGTIADGSHQVALTGRVWCWVDADANGSIVPGSLLTTSPTPGHAMRASDRERSFGATIGKAMTPLERGQGLVLLLVNLH